jgi:uncharacterized protein YciI
LLARRDNANGAKLDTMAYQQYVLALMRRRPDGTVLEGDELAANSAAHREYLTGLREEGRVVTNGLLIDHPDPAVTGLIIYSTGSLEEARLLLDADPAVAVGRLTADLMLWRAPEGSMRIPGMTVES